MYFWKHGAVRPNDNFRHRYLGCDEGKHFRWAVDNPKDVIEELSSLSLDAPILEDANGRGVTAGSFLAMITLRDNFRLLCGRKNP